MCLGSLAVKQKKFKEVHNNIEMNCLARAWVWDLLGQLSNWNDLLFKLNPADNFIFFQPIFAHFLFWPNLKCGRWRLFFSIYDGAFYVDLQFVLLSFEGKVVDYSDTALSLFIHTGIKTCRISFVQPLYSEWINTNARNMSTAPIFKLHPRAKSDISSGKNHPPPPAPTWFLDWENQDQVLTEEWEMWLVRSDVTDTTRHNHLTSPS